MRYLIIGLGVYASNLARFLADSGNEVVGADIRPANVDAVKEHISTAYIIDSTDPAALSVLPLNNVDLTVVAIGENFGASIKTVAQLRRFGVRKIYARAIDELHRSILEGLKVDRILNPEQRAAHDLTGELQLGTNVSSMRVDADTYVIQCKAPEFYFQMKYSDVPSELHGMRLIAATRPVKSKNVLGIEHDKMTLLNISAAGERVAPGDVFTVMGTDSQLKSLYKAIK